MTNALFGAIADDVTGACDLAGEVSAAGLSTEVWLGVPARGAASDAECVVVALKSRTAPAGVAVAESVGAGRWLIAQGAPLLYQKYCSTFDSTAGGNIGPTADALRGLSSPQAITVGTPATPAAGRTQYQGHLFVHGQLLSESSLARHPLTPMTDSDLLRVLARQTRTGVGLVAHEEVRRGPRAIADEVLRLRAAGIAHVLVDAVCDDDLDALAAAIALVGQGIVPGGGAGLGTAIARTMARSSAAPAPALPAVPEGRRLILSGSGSERTRHQVEAFAGEAIAVDPLRLARDGASELQRLTRQLDDALSEDDGPVLVSATAAPAQVERVQQQLGAPEAARLVEDTLAALAVTATASLNVRRLIVAGGETSGAVTAALGIRSLSIGRRAAPGVPWAVAQANGAPATALLLKSGNFGGEDLFSTAWESAP